MILLLLRSLIYQVFFIGSTLVFSLAILLIGWMVSDTLIARLARSWARVNLAALRLICRLDYRVQGLEHLPRDTAIVLCKHQSAWEIIALRAMLPFEQSWVLKQELMRIPVFGWALKRLHPIAIDRAAGRRAAAQIIREGERLLNAGRWIVIFPEGTRVAPGVRQPYAIGGAMLAERSGRPVVPIAHNAGYFWGRRRFVKSPGTIDVVIGPLLETQGRKAAEINTAVEEWIESTLDALPKPD